MTGSPQPLRSTSASVQIRSAKAWHALLRPDVELSSRLLFPNSTPVCVQRN